MDQLINQYIEAARNQKDSESYEIANEWHAKLIQIYMQLRNIDKLAELKQLLTNAHIGVRSWAATHYLQVDETLAKNVLREIANKGGLAGLSAETVIKEWDNGNLKRYYSEL